MRVRTLNAFLNRKISLLAVRKLQARRFFAIKSLKHNGRHRRSPRAYPPATSVLLFNTSFSVTLHLLRLLLFEIRSLLRIYGTGRLHGRECPRALDGWAPWRRFPV